MGLISTPVEQTAQFAAEVIREAVECDRPDCLPEQHTRFVEENLAIAADHIRENRNPKCQP